MFITERNKSKEHVYWEALERRRVLGDDESGALRRCRSGYAGEQQYDAIFDEVGHDTLYVYRDIWLNLDGATVQLDALIIADNTLIVNEIKNYSGSYTYSGGIWTVRKKQISEDPVSQINRTAGKLVKLRYETGFSFEIRKEIIFPNPYFILETADYKDQSPIIMRSHLKQYFRSLGSYRSSQSAKALAAEIHKRLIDNPFPTPKTDYGRLQPGLNCWKCGGYNQVLRRFVTECADCGYSEPIERQIVRTVIEYAVLFPGEPVTKKRIFEFAGGLVSGQKIQRTLGKHFQVVKNGNQSYYQIKHKDVFKTLIEANYSSCYEHDPEFIFKNHPRSHKLKKSFV